MRDLFILLLFLGVAHGDQWVKTTASVGCFQWIDDCKTKYLDSFQGMDQTLDYDECIWEAICRTPEEILYREQLSDQIQKMVHWLDTEEAQIDEGFFLNKSQCTASPTVAVLVTFTILARLL